MTRRLVQWRNDRELRLIDAWAAMGLGTRTINHYLSAVRHAEAWCEEHGYQLRTLPAHAAVELSHSVPFTWASRLRLRSALSAYWDVYNRRHPPTRAIRVPRKPLMRSRALDVPAAAALEQAARARGDHKGLAVLVGLYLGLRRFEIANLDWGNFDGELAWVTITGKGDVIADLPVHPVLSAALKAFGPKSSGFVFPGRFGRGVHAATIWAWVKDVAKEAQLNPISTHVLRHTCLTTANDVTRDLRAVQLFARHAHPDTTAGYTRVSTKRIVQVMLSLDYAAGAEEVSA